MCPYSQIYSTIKLDAHKLIKIRIQNQDVSLFRTLANVKKTTVEKTNWWPDMVLWATKLKMWSQCVTTAQQMLCFILKLKFLLHCVEYFFLPSDVKNSTFLSLEVENSPNQTWCWCYQMGTSEWSSLLELLEESVYKRWWKYGLNISAPLGLAGVWNYMGKAKIDSISLSPSQHNRVSGGAPIDKHFFFK